MATAVADFVAAANKYVDNFSFTNGVTPLSSIPTPFIAVAVYLILVRVLRAWMAGRKPMEIRGVLIMHNSVLSLASLVLFACLTWILVERYFSHDLVWMLCSADMHENGQLQMIYYINYLFKYYELLDTAFLLLRKREVAFLHEYHHAATLVLAWVEQHEHGTPQWVPIVLNLFVHVLMYYYYALSALRIRVWWKRHLTTMQIIQFVLDVAAMSYCYARFLRATSADNSCHGTQFGAIVGIGILFSYLLLFVQFYFDTYRRVSKAKADAQKKTQ